MRDRKEIRWDKDRAAEVHLEVLLDIRDLLKSIDRNVTPESNRGISFKNI